MNRNKFYKIYKNIIPLVHYLVQREKVIQNDSRARIVEDLLYVGKEKMLPNKRLLILLLLQSIFRYSSNPL